MLFLFFLGHLFTPTEPVEHTALSVHVLTQKHNMKKRYLLGRLKTLCEEAIRKSITVETVCTIFLLAHKHNAEGLKVRPTQFVSEPNFEMFYQRETRHKFVLFLALLE